MFWAMISLPAETHAFLDGNLKIYTLELIKVSKHYWEGYIHYSEVCQNSLGRLPNFVGKFIGKFAKLYLEGC